MKVLAALLVSFMVLASISFAYANDFLFTPQDLLGKWSKDYSLINGQENRDPRWELSITFAQDGTFTYSSRQTQEEWLSGGGSKARITEVALAGKYTFKDEQVTLHFNTEPSDAQKSELMTLANYNKTQNTATLAIVKKHSMRMDRTNQQVYFTNKPQ